MQYSLAKTTAGRQRKMMRNDLRLVKDGSTNNSQVDFGVFGTREIRDVLKSRAHCLQAGFSPDHIIIKTLNEIRDHYLLKVGLPTYLSQMLGALGNTRIEYCTLYKANGQRMNIHLNGNHTQPVQQFIARQFGADNLPTKITMRTMSNPDRVEVRYL